MNPILVAVKLAHSAHKGQVRKYNGKPYITHPVRVMHRYMIVPGATEVGACAAVMHDVVEDTKITRADLSDRGFCQEAVDLVYWLTNLSKSRTELPRAERKALDRGRIRNAPRTAKQIKLIDRADNLGEMDVRADAAFAKLYLAESDLLLRELRDTDDVLENELHAAIESLSAQLS